MEIPQPHTGLDRALRLVTILAWIPTFALSLPHGLVYNSLLPALGILPMTFSAFIGLVHLAGLVKAKALNIATDLFCACFLFAVLVPSWLVLTRQDYFDKYAPMGYVRRNAVLGTYATMPMMINLAIHLWFLLRELSWPKLSWSKTKTCPHCHGHLGRRSAQGYEHVSDDDTPTERNGKGDPSTTRAVDDKHSDRSVYHDPRPSTDDETARLV